ncbi:hypothetical protein Tco_1452263 [Tanacetum coccineum]
MVIPSIISDVQMAYVEGRNILEGPRIINEVNFEKSRLFGVGVTFGEVDALASSLKCKAASLPFIYLGLPVGVLDGLANYYFSLFRTPISVLEFLEQIRRRFFWGVTRDARKIHWVAWEKVLRLFALEEIKDRRVNNIVEHILTGQIDRCNWRRLPRGGREEEEPINLRSELEGVEFSNQVDYLQWSITD